MKLKTGWTKSCGCFREINTRQIKTIHGYSHTRLHNIWCGIRSRCTNSNWRSADVYVKRGIKLCEEWQEFEPFKDWALSHGYADNLSIDRIDVNGNYEPSNCRWADVHTQMNNTTRNIVISYDGETHTLAEWARIKNVEYAALKGRYALGWSVKDMFERPYKTGSKSLMRQQEKECA